jgi:hypothetical protein
MSSDIAYWNRFDLSSWPDGYLYQRDKHYCISAV